VLLLTPTIRDVALIEFPSTRAEMICTRLAVESLFILWPAFKVDNLSRIVDNTTALG